MKSVLSIFFFLWPIMMHAQYSAQEILMLASKSISIRKSVSYQAECYIKLFLRDDTMRFSGDVRLLKEASDTIFGGYIWYQRDDTTQKMYDMQGMYIIDSKNRKITRFNPHMGEYWPMTSDIRNNMVLSYFFEPEKLYNNANGPATIKLLNDTIISGINCYKVLMVFPDDEVFSDYEIEICVTKDDKMPILRYSKVKNEGNYEYKSIRIKNHKFNTLKKSDFVIKHPYNSYHIDTFIRPAPPKLLSNGTNAPKITGKHYQDNLTEKTIDFGGKVTLLDYWYMGCPYCIESLPTIDKLLQRYQNDGLQVFGINPVDIKLLDKLANFVENHTITYPIYFVEEDLLQLYSIGGFPAFYIIDRNGVVKLGRLGFTKDTENALSEAIETALRQ